MKFFIRTFGCQMNVADSFWISSSLISKGFEMTSKLEEADIILVNTCSVRKKPEEKLYSFLGRIYPYFKRNSELIVGVGGCVAQQLGEKIWKKFPFVRLIFGTDGIPYVPQSVERLLSTPSLKISLLDFKDYYPERELVINEQLLNNHPVAYVNIMQGCDNFCAYCIVPYTRGRQKSRHSKKVIEECKRLVDAGVSEIMLLGQNVNSYGQDNYGDGVSFEELLIRVSKIQGLKRIRFTTSHPKDISDQLIGLFGELNNLCPAIHLPLQAGSNRILKLMGRKYLKEDYLKIIDKLKKVRDDIVITTDLIVGFPGESKEDFQETLEMVKRVEFDSSFSFKYSDRPGTRAEKMGPKVDEKIKSERLRELQNIQDELTLKSMNKLYNQVVEVLVEGMSSKQKVKDYISLKGREPGGRVVNFLINKQRANQISVGSIAKVKITEVKKHSLFGEVIK